MEVAKKVEEGEQCTKCLMLQDAGPHLICSRCLLYMIPPIYVCENEHSYCRDCQLEDSTCTYCAKQFFLRNIALEVESIKAMFHCRWEYDCDTFKFDTIRDHENNCQFRIYSCPCCELFMTFPQVNLHFIDEHLYAQLIQNNYYLSNRRVSNLWFMITYREIFIGEILIEPDSVVWRVRLTSGRYSRAMDFRVYLDVCGTIREILICVGLPCFVLELPNAELPLDDEFAYCVTVLPTRDCIKI